jgi:hypothetical protein
MAVGLMIFVIGVRVLGRITPSFRQLYEETASELRTELQAALVDLGHKNAFDLLLYLSMRLKLEVTYSYKISLQVTFVFVVRLLEDDDNAHAPLLFVSRADDAVVIVVITIATSTGIAFVDLLLAIHIPHHLNTV